MRTIVLMAAVVTLVACAGTPVQSARHTLPKSEYEVDVEKIARVERQARMSWAQVHWISLPRKRIESDRYREGDY